MTDGLKGSNYDHTSLVPNVTLYRLGNVFHGAQLKP